ncbi:adenosylhomocysteine nucleosidase [Devosia subaequoris]|uniref:Adenosylhomocysteine nucleosidase n=1 Tax=Devosia subaequoris TaxID=395930 RepID=A0A7W6IIV4_9HYPH|nr:5'-methylthioadenosine/S-adenosylhomocysteine nucleosidase [Devosia subaequoris]MBB4050462.1 adenosylhomocysteine nucleosidase [Devosia subaequoris]MCP1208850.1 5'-methylthioadenosine/S-adenosylhomocysteine nucleosidase [Devosia subaequoris]
MPILYLMAAEPEYGPHLRARITPHMVGVGPVEAAVNATRIIACMAANPPELVVSLGSAGSRSLEQCAVYQAISVSYRDMDASALGFSKGVTPFLDLPATLPLEPLVPGLVPATLSTGANVVSGAAYDSVSENMVDMETFAILRACQAFDIPLLALRGISDGKAEVAGMADWTQYLHIVDERLAAAVDLIEDHYGLGA